MPNPKHPSLLSGKSGIRKPTHPAPGSRNAFTIIPIRARDPAPSLAPSAPRPNTPSATSGLPESISGFVLPSFPWDADVDKVPMTYNFDKRTSQTKGTKNGNEDDDYRAPNIWKCATGPHGLISSLHQGFQMTEAEREKMFRSMFGASDEKTEDLTGCWVEESVTKGTQGTLHLSNKEGAQRQMTFTFDDGTPADALKRLRESVSSRVGTIEPSMGA